MAVFFIFNLLILLINLVILPIYDVIDMWNPRLSTIGATVKVGYYDIMCLRNKDAQTNYPKGLISAVNQSLYFL